jgi:signal transduction histidine kinase
MFPPSECPYCSYPLLCHVRQGKPYWFCNRCHQEAFCGINPSSAGVGLESTEPPLNLFEPLTQISEKQSDREIQEQITLLQKKQEKLLLLKEDFLNTMSHELRTPLSNMRLSIQMLELILCHSGLLVVDQKNSGLQPTSIAHFIHILKEECEKEICLINDLLTLQQLEAEIQPLLPISICLKSWFPQMVETFERKASNHQLKFQIDIPADLPTLVTDFAMLERLFKELLTNACKFTPLGESITITASTHVGWIQVRISNSGVEIPANELDHIFDKFYRIPNDDPWKHAGTGLGLALVKQLASHLSGSIWAESGSGQTSFVVELPCQESQEPSQLDLLIGYVAYYVSRGRTIVSPTHGAFPFDGTVYQYWGFHNDFLRFWRSLHQRWDFRELYLEGDIYNFGHFLQKSCIVQECARCRLPIQLAEQGVYNAGCPCDQRFFLEQTQPHQFPQPAETEQEITRIAVIGSLPADAKILDDWFSHNQFEVTFVAEPETMPAQILAQAIDLVLIDTALSETQANQWAKQLRRYPELREVPIVALSPQNASSLPWIDRSLGVEDYILTPLGGDRLAHHLRQLVRDRAIESAAELHWFPR